MTLKQAIQNALHEANLLEIKVLKKRSKRAIKKMLENESLCIGSEGITLQLKISEK